MKTSGRKQKEGNEKRKEKSKKEFDSDIESEKRS
jgi:hypothetical protein